MSQQRPRISRDLPHATDVPLDRQAAMITARGVAPPALRVAPLHGLEEAHGDEWTESNRPETVPLDDVHEMVRPLLGTRSGRVRIIGFLPGRRAPMLGRCICGILVLRRAKSWRKRLADGAQPDQGCRACNRAGIIARKCGVKYEQGG